MRILLPPSEGKNAGGRGRPLSARARPTPLDEPRARVRDAVAALVAGDPELAATALALPASVREQALKLNARTADSPTVAALERYSGIVYDGLSAGTLPPLAAVTARSCVLVFSGLLGVVRGGDPVPNYRVPASTPLPGLGIAATYWRPWLTAVMPALLDDGLILDLRSGDYAAMWTPAPGSDAHRRRVQVRITSPRPDGSYGVISYPSKFHKGRLARELILRAASGEAVTTVEQVAEAWRRMGQREATVVERRGALTLELPTVTATVVG